MNKIRSYTSVELAKILDATEECLLQATDQEILSESEEMGEVPEVVAQEVRAMLLNGLMRHKKARLHAAEVQHSLQVAELGQRKTILPGTPAGRKRLLERVLQSLAALSPGQPVMATVQFRMGSELTDDEVSQQLLQMSQLSLLDATPDEEEED